MTTGTDPGIVKSVVETVLKPFTIIFTPIAERIARVLKRKPKLHIYVLPVTSILTYAWDGSSRPIMQATFACDITNDDHHEKVIIIDAYIKGTKPCLPTRGYTEIAPASMKARQQFATFCRPVLGEAGKNFTGRVVLLDQFKRKHLTDKIEFVWHGPTERPGKVEI